MKCPRCGNEIINNVKNCPTCGYDLTEEYEDIKKAKEEKEREIKSKNKIDTKIIDKAPKGKFSFTKFTIAIILTIMSISLYIFSTWYLINGNISDNILYISLGLIMGTIIFLTSIYLFYDSYIDPKYLKKYSIYIYVGSIIVALIGAIYTFISIFNELGVHLFISISILIIGLSVFIIDAIIEKTTLSK